MSHLQTRADVQRHLLDLCQRSEAVAEAQAPGVTCLEGFASILWGLAPALSECRPGEDPDEDLLEIANQWCQRIQRGTDPATRDFWGSRPCQNLGQDMAAIGFAIWMIPSIFWAPLSPAEKRNVEQWLLNINAFNLPDDHSQWFRVIVNAALSSLDQRHSRTAIDDSLAVIETFYGYSGHGPDGSYWRGAYDYHATSFSLPFYLIIGVRMGVVPDSNKAWHRVSTNAQLAVNLFAPSGRCIPYGRDLSAGYETAAIWSAMAWSEQDFPDFDPGILKGLVLRTIRAMTVGRDINGGHIDGRLSSGAEEGAGSDFRSFASSKAFLMLALPASHAFWKAEETSPRSPPRYVSAKPWCQVVVHAAGHHFVLNGQDRLSSYPNFDARFCKLAYSSHYGISAPRHSGETRLGNGGMDSGIAVSEDGDSWTCPSYVENAAVWDHGTVWTTWMPDDSTTIWTWLMPPATVSTPWHTRVHRIRSNRRLHFASTGFSVPRTGVKECQSTSVIINTEAGVSGIFTMLATNIEANVDAIDAGHWTNLMWKETVFPGLMGQIETAGVDAWVALRVLATPTSKDDSWNEHWDALTPWSDLEHCRREYGFIP